MSDTYRPGLEDVIAASTQVSFLDLEAEQILIRGYDLIELAERASYTDVAHLLIHGKLPTPGQQAMFCERLAADADLPPGMEDVLRTLPPGLDAMDSVRTGLSALAGFEDPAVLASTDHGGNVEKCVRILAKAPAVAANAYRVTHGMDMAPPEPSRGFAGSFLSMIPSAATDDEAVATFDRVLTCYSEHELANSTLTARVVASTLADVYCAVVAAAAALKGPLHGGANEAAARMFAEIAERGGSDQAEAYVLERLERRDRIMGFGHRVYMHRTDPRALLLTRDLDRLGERSAEAADLVRSYEACSGVMQREKGLFPNADLPIGLIMYLLDIPIELYTPVFLCARIAGLAAHVIEQQDDNRLFRPRVLYQGPRDLHPDERFSPSSC